MKDFAELVHEPCTGQQKTKQEIRDTTRGKIPKPDDYIPHQKLAEWDASLSIGQQHLLSKCQPMRDRILVKLLSGMRKNSVMLTDPEPLIGGCRKAVVLKTRPGRWIPDDGGAWLRPVSGKPGDVVLIGNWVGLQVEEIGRASCRGRV